MSCGCSVSTAQEVVDKVRKKGVDKVALKKSYTINCECNCSFEMLTHLSTCPNCQAIYAVTPCKSDDKKNIVKLEQI